ncbi:MAG: hypothetical protein H0Z37_05950 [Firmicutes bacterium]|nr:hypothetical protein [Bacillota bacterium]
MPRIMPALRNGKGVWGLMAAAGIAAGLALAVFPRPESGVAPGPGTTSGPAGTAVPAATKAYGAGERVVFRMDDPRGDDRGPGTYRYPIDPSFVPGLYDLQSFTVLVAQDNIVFDLTFGTIANPFRAPEGFYHQLIDIYIHTGPGGRTEPLIPGPRVRFDPAYPWTARVRAEPFGGSRLDRADDESGSGVTSFPARALVLDDGRTIRVSVPEEALGTPDRSWRYYVLIGGFDPYGPDGYRTVRPQATAWSFGGDPSGAGPLVIDLLAPRFWPSQARQLGSFRQNPPLAARLHPVGPSRWPRWALPALALLFLAAAAFCILRLMRRRRA